MKNHFDTRQAFNFYRSYYETMILLPEDEQLSFLKAIIEAQFTGEIIDPESNWAKLAFRSQMHSVKKQLIGFNKGKNTYPNGNPTKGTYKGKDKGSHKEVQVQGEEQEQGKGKEEYIVYRQFDHLKITQAEFDTLAETFSHDAIEDVLNQIQNYAKNKQYKSLYLTALTWLKRDAKRKETAPTEKLNTFANFKLPQ